MDLSARASGSKMEQAQLLVNRKVPHVTPKQARGTEAVVEREDKLLADDTTSSSAVRDATNQSTDKIETFVKPPQASSDRRAIVPHQWSGSTIELNADMFSNEHNCLLQRRRACRVIEKNGRENVSIRNIPQKSSRFIRDLVTTLLELKWKYVLGMFLGSYCCSWLSFAILGYIVSYTHGDLTFDPETGKRIGGGREPCNMGVHNFLTMFIYSVELQTTLGFGEKYPTEQCPPTIFLYILQIIVSIGIEGGMVSIIYAKIARPAKQMTKLRFSDKAVICHRDGELCLLFRVCDLREQQTISSKIRVYMIMDISTHEGEVIKTHTELKLQNDGEQIIVWPEIVCHVIDATSPLACYRNAGELLAASFELYVSIVGESSATALTTEARTSYVPSEIYWGQRFVNILDYNAATGRYVIDHSHFNTTISVDMCSGH